MKQHLLCIALPLKKDKARTIQNLTATQYTHSLNLKRTKLFADKTWKQEAEVYVAAKNRIIKTRLDR